MKKLIYAMAILLLAATVNAQDIPFQIQKSEVFKDDYSNSQIVLAEKIQENQLIIVRSYKSEISVKKGFYIEKYDKSLNKISDFDFEFDQPRYEKYSVFLGSFFNKSKVYLIEMLYDLKSKNYVCLAHVIDENYEVSKQELFRLGKDEVKGFGLQNLYKNFNLSSNNLGLFEVEKNSDFNFFKGTISSDVSDNRSRSDLVFKINKAKTFFSVALAYSFEDNDITKLFLFDSNLNKQNEKEFAFEKNVVINKNIDLHDSLGVIYLTQKVFPKRLRDKEIGGKYNYEVKRISKDETNIKIIDVENHFLTSLTSFYYENKLYGIGFYSDRDDFQYSGIAYYDLDAQNLEIKNFKYSPFPQQFILDKYGKLNDKEFKNIVINGFYRDEKKDFFIHAEETYRTVTSGQNAQSYQSFDDIISLSLTSYGDIVTARNINKVQSIISNEDSSFLSYTSFVLNNKNYFFINAKDKLKDLSGERVEFKGANVVGNANLYIISVDNDGKFEYKEVISNDNNEVSFMVSKGVKIDNSIFFLGRKGKKKQLLKVTL